MRTFKVFLVSFIVFSLLALQGCSSNINKDKFSDEENDVLSITTSLVHGSPSGVWFMLGTAISESLGKSYPGSIMHVNPGQSAANVYRMNREEIEFGLVHSYIAYEAINGLGQYEEKMNNIGGVAVFYSSPLQFVVSADKGVSTFDEFIENRIPLKLSLSSLGGNSEEAFYNLLDVYGLTREDLEDWGCEFYSIRLNDSGDSFADGVIDGLFIMASLPTPTLIQMGINSDVVMVSINRDVIAAMSEKYGFSEFSVPAGSYTYVTEDVLTFNTYTMLGASLSTSVDHVYKVTKSLVENIDYLKTVHSSFEEISADSFLLNMGMPLHPGAEKYYKEAGLVD